MQSKRLNKITVTTSGNLDVEVGYVLSSNTFPNFYQGVTITGASTLTGNLNIAPVGTPIKNSPLMIFWSANVNLNNNDIYLFGTKLPAQSASEKWYAIVMWDGTQWLVNHLANWPAVDGNFELVQGSIIQGGTDGRQVASPAGKEAYILIGQGKSLESKSVKGVIGMNKEGSTWFNPAVITGDDLGSSAVSFPSKRAADLNREVMSFWVSFETDYAGEGYKVPVPFKAQLLESHFSVIKEIAGTDNGQVTVMNNVGGVAGVQSISSSAAVGQIFTKTNYGVNHLFDKGDFLQVTSEKPTDGGVLLASFVFKRID